jgi:hypothetical protein
VTSGPIRPATTLVAFAVLTVTATLVLLASLPGLAAAAPAGHPAQADSASRPLAPAPATPATRGPRLELRVATLTPRVVTSTGPTDLTLTGQLVNTGDQPVRRVGVRAQRGDRLRGEGDVRTALAGAASNDAVTPSFTPVVDRLAPGESAPVRMRVPLRGSTTGSLALSRTGVYELLVNVNGAGDSGELSRMTGVRMLLPVLGLPADSANPSARPAEPATADGTGSTPVSMLYPLADQPHRLPTGPGEPVLLGDSGLGISISRGGRLAGLLDALDTGAPVGSPVRASICLAVDPDLLRTVADMSGGYRVRTPDGQDTDGRAAAAAGAWLDRLRGAAAGHCVIALPFADADLVALSRAGLDDLARYAAADGARIAADILRTPVRADTTWPADGLLDERSLTDYAHSGGRTAVLSADAVAISGRSRDITSGLVRLSTPGAAATGLLTDPLIGLAAHGQGGGAGAGLLTGDVGGGGSGRGLGSLSDSDDTSPAGSGATLSDQDAIGTTVFRALAGSIASASSGSSAGGSTGRSAGAVVAPLVVAPPHRWNTTAADAGDLLGTLGTLIAAGRLSPAALPDPPAARSDSGSPAATAPDSEPVPDASLVYPLRAGAREVPGAVTQELRTDQDAAADLRSAAVSEPGVGATPAQVFDPVTEGLLRAGSSVWRGSPALADQATGVITERVALLRSLVRVLEPPSPYALGDKEAPLPVTLANGLPVAMNVRLALSATPGLRTEATPDQRIPPNGRLQLRVNASLSRSGQFSVEARLTTLSGSPLGVPSRLLLRSTAYGTITLWLTGTAGVLLVILAVRRIARRLRGTATRRPGGEGSTVSSRPPTGPPGWAGSPPPPVPETAGGRSRPGPRRPVGSAGSSRSRTSTAPLDPAAAPGTVPTATPTGVTSPIPTGTGRPESPRPRRDRPIGRRMTSGPERPVVTGSRNGSRPARATPASDGPPATPPTVPSIPPTTPVTSITPVSPSVPRRTTPAPWTGQRTTPRYSDAPITPPPVTPPAVTRPVDAVRPTRRAPREPDPADPRPVRSTRRIPPRGQPQPPAVQPQPPAVQPQPPAVQPLPPAVQPLPPAVQPPMDPRPPPDRPRRVRPPNGQPPTDPTPPPR